jgi:hypothetical protein
VPNDDRHASDVTGMDVKRAGCVEMFNTMVPTRGGARMDLVMNLATTIEDFHTLLTSDDNSLLATLRELTKIERVEEIVAAVLDADEYWYGDS